MDTSSPNWKNQSDWGHREDRTARTAGVEPGRAATCHARLPYEHHTSSFHRALLSIHFKPDNALQYQQYQRSKEPTVAQKPHKADL
jgi:hypothetical protein